MKKIDCLYKRHGFSFINGKLLEVDIVRQEFHECDGSICSNIAVVNNGSEYVTGVDNFYESEDAFKAGKKYGKTLSVNLIGALFDVYKDLSSDEAFNLWTYEDGQPVNKIIRVSDVFVTFDGRKVIAESPQVPKATYYPSREHVMMVHDIRVVSADGNERTEYGIFSKLLLNDTQRAALKNFEDAYKNLIASGVKIMMYIDGAAYVYNTAGIDSDIYYDDRDAKADGFDIVAPLHELSEFGTSFSIASWSDEYGAFFKKSQLEQ